MTTAHPSHWMPTCAIDALYLPMPESAFKPCRHADLSPRRVPWHSVWPVVTPDLNDASSVAEYRWFVGHHAVFCVWRLLLEALRAIAVDSGPITELVSRAVLLYDSYSTLLLYSGSCSAEVYGERIRSLMSAADVASSGQWHRDYEPIPAALRRAHDVHPPDLLAPLVAAVRTNQAVQMAIAARLTPEEITLLREISHRGAPPTTEQKETIDNFFLVRRMSLCRNEFNAQFVIVLTKIRRDLAFRPLVTPCSWPELSERQTGVIDRFHHDSIALLSHLEDGLE